MSNPEISDNHSIFSNDEGLSFTFNRTKLEELVSQHSGKPCLLQKLAEGGYHKVYHIKFCLAGCLYHDIGV